MKPEASPVLYHLYIRSFFDSNNDGIGDLEGIIARIDYFQWLGVDGILLSPVFASPLSDFGYDITDIRTVHHEYGDLATFDRLLSTAQKHGIEVFIDYVANHTSTKHPWFIDSSRNRDGEKADWYVWADANPDGTPPNNWLTIFGESAWRWHPTRGQYYLHNTLSNQPDLNYRNPGVARQLLDDVRFWLDRGVNGLRLDSANLLTHDGKLRNNPARHMGWQDPARGDPYRYQSQRYNISRPENINLLKQLRFLVDSYPQSPCLLGSLSDPSPYPVIDRYTSEGDALDAANVFEALSLCRNMQQVGEQLQAFFNGVHPGLGCWSTGNHDITRTASRWQGAENRPEAARLLLAMLCTLRGVIFLYQGEELGLGEANVDPAHRKDLFGQQVIADYVGRDGCRTPFPWQHDAPYWGFSRAEPWLPVDHEHGLLAVDRQMANSQSTLHFMRDFLRWRKQQPAIIGGECRLLAFNHDLLVLERHHPEQSLICAFNGSSNPARIQLNLPAGVEVLPSPGCQDTGSHHGLVQGGLLELAPWQAWYGEMKY